MASIRVLESRAPRVIAASSTRNSLSRILAAAVVAGCSGEAVDNVPFPDAGVLEYRACDPAAHVGGFEVELAADYTGVQGQVFDGVNPSAVLETLQTEDDCRRAHAPVYFCDPSCSSGELCNAESKCVPYPTARDVGTVAVTGMLSAVEMEALPPANYYTNPESLPHPGFKPGADLLLETTGGETDPFQLRGWGVAALVVDQIEVAVESGSAVPLTWDAPPEAGPARLRISLNIDGHGTSGSRILCDVPDTGSFAIPEALVTALMKDGLSGFPSVTLDRTTADSTEVESGCVEFRVHSARVVPVSIPGLVSCDGNEDCTPPETCQTDLTCG